MLAFRVTWVVIGGSESKKNCELMWLRKTKTSSVEHENADQYFQYAQATFIMIIFIRSCYRLCDLAFSDLKASSERGAYSPK
jgi:hypothetical protein